MLPSETVSQTAGFNLLPHVTVSVAGIEPATPSFQARMSTNDLHADGQGDWNRTSLNLFPKQVDNHYPTPLWTPAESNRAVPGFNRTQSPDLPDVRVSPRFRAAFSALKGQRLSQWSSETRRRFS